MDIENELNLQLDRIYSRAKSAEDLLSQQVRELKATLKAKSVKSAEVVPSNISDIIEYYSQFKADAAGKNNENEK